jgi:hypothetical protein
MLTVLVGGAGGPSASLRGAPLWGRTGPSALDGVDYWVPDVLGLERIVAGLMGQV